MYWLVSVKIHMILFWFLGHTKRNATRSLSGLHKALCRNKKKMLDCGLDYKVYGLRDVLVAVVREWERRRCCQSLHHPGRESQLPSCTALTIRLQFEFIAIQLQCLGLHAKVGRSWHYSLCYEIRCRLVWVLLTFLFPTSTSHCGVAVNSVLQSWFNWCLFRAQRTPSNF